MMLKDICYSVACEDEKSCQKKHMPLSAGFNPKVAYVFKDKKNASYPGVQELLKFDYVQFLAKSQNLSIKNSSIIESLLMTK